MPRVSAKEDHDQLLPRLGAAVRARRKAMQMSQESLADLAGIDRSHMGRIERGERKVTILNLARIAAALEVSPSDPLASAGL